MRWMNLVARRPTPDSSGRSGTRIDNTSTFQQRVPRERERARDSRFPYPAKRGAAARVAVDDGVSEIDGAVTPPAQSAQRIFQRKLRQAWT